MDIHKPKAAHSWREFLIEIGTIICGILIALGLEQVVEWTHWRKEVAETREALDHELRTNLARLQNRERVAPCVRERLADTQHYLNARAAGDHRAPPRVLPQLKLMIRLNNNVWESAKASASVARMPVADRNRYAAAFARLSYVKDRSDELVEAWTSLQLINDAPLLSNAGWDEVIAARNRVQQIESAFEENSQAIIPSLLKALADGGEHPPPAPPPGIDSSNPLCQPWYPAKSAATAASAGRR